ncbi:MAG: DNA-processing protein DprA, partial [Deltaproteobacteria bacterium]|nr:DNA-processing protein DprA [Deltaproteobacteria bacterium]
MAVEDNRYWIALNLVPGIGSVSYRNLIGVFHGPRQVFKASPKGLGKVEGIGPKLAEAILSFPLEKRLRDELRLMDRYGVSAVTYREPGYPRILLEIFDPPPVLYVRGSLEAAGSTAVAIVGSRRATAQGRAFTEQLARDLAAQG